MIGHCKGCGAVKLGEGLCNRCLEVMARTVLGAFCQKCERRTAVVSDTVMDGRFYQVILCKFANCGAEITRELSECERGAL